MKITKNIALDNRVKLAFSNYFRFRMKALEYALKEASFEAAEALCLACDFAARRLSVGHAHAHQAGQSLFSIFFFVYKCM